MKKGIVAFILFAAVPFFFTSLPFQVRAYQSPGKPTGFVNDFADVISPAKQAELESNLSTFQKQTGREIAVVTVPTIGSDEVIETYAVKLFEEWGIGGKEKDTGLLLVIALKEKKMRIEVGYGLEGDLTDTQASQIIRNILAPAFQKGDYEGGIANAVMTIEEVLKKNPEALPPENSQSEGDSEGGNLGVLLYFILFVPMWLASILGRSKSWWAGGVLGGVVGVVLGFVYGFFFIGIMAIVGLGVAGLIFDYIVSKTYHTRVSRGMTPPWWIGGGRGGRGGGFGGGGFGGFGGGRSGGGGASGGW